MDKKIDLKLCLLCYTDINENDLFSYKTSTYNFNCHSFCFKSIADDNMLEHYDFDFNNPSNFEILKNLRNSEEKCDECDKILKLKEDKYYKEFNKDDFVDASILDCEHKICSACWDKYLKFQDHTECLDSLECIYEDYTHCVNIPKCPVCYKT